MNGRPRLAPLMELPRLVQRPNQPLNPSSHPSVPNHSQLPLPRNDGPPAGKVSAVAAKLPAESKDDVKVESKVVSPTAPDSASVVDSKTSSDTASAGQPKKGKKRAIPAALEGPLDEPRGDSLAIGHGHPLAVRGLRGKLLRTHKVLYKSDSLTRPWAVWKRCFMSWLLLALSGPNINLIEYTMVGATYAADQC